MVDVERLVARVDVSNTIEFLVGFDLSTCPRNITNVGFVSIRYVTPTHVWKQTNVQFPACTSFSHPGSASQA